MRTTDFDRLATLAPLNATAAIVRDGLGEHHDGPNLGERQHWKAPPLPLEPRPANLPDLTGQQFGRLTVIRFHGRSGVSKPVFMWLVRCACGDYEVRRHKKLLNNANPETCCGVCDHTLQLRARASKTPTARSRRNDDLRLDAIASGERP